MRAKVEVSKSFDEGNTFTKEYAPGDFKEFFLDEGGYLDRLTSILNDRGKECDEFTVTYTVTVKK